MDSRRWTSVEHARTHKIAQIQISLHTYTSTPLDKDKVNKQAARHFDVRLVIVQEGRRFLHKHQAQLCVVRNSAGQQLEKCIYINAIQLLVLK